MRRMGLGGCAAALGMLAFAAIAPARAEHVIVVVDENRVWAESLAGKDVQAQIKAFQERANGTLKSASDQLKKDAETLRTQKDELKISEAAFAQKLRELQQKENDFQRSLQEQNVRVQIANQLARKQFHDAAEPIMVQLVKERQGTILLDRAQLLYMAPDVDITGDVIARLDKATPKLAVELDVKDQGTPGASASAPPAATEGVKGEAKPKPKP